MGGGRRWSGIDGWRRLDDGRAGRLGGAGEQTDREADVEHDVMGCSLRADASTWKSEHTG